MKIEHIGIAIEQLEEGEKLFSTLFNQPVYKQEYVESEKVLTSFIALENTKIELLVATDKDSPIAKFIAQRGPGLHHIAFQVDHLESEIDRLKNEGFQFTQSEIKRGADNKRIVFLHPKSTGRILIELCEEIIP